MQIIETTQITPTTLRRNRVSVLGRGLDWWNGAMLLSLLFAAIAAIVVAFSTKIILVLQDRAATAQRQEFDAYKISAKRDSDIAIAKARADADVKIQASRNDAQVKIDAAKSEAGKKIAAIKDDEAKVNLSAEELKKANLDLERAVSPRILEQGHSAATLRQFSGTSFAILSPTDFEPKRTAGQISWMLRYAGWARHARRLTEDFAFFDGVVVHADVGNVRATAAADALVSVLNDNGIAARRGYPPVSSEPSLVIVVGTKPLPKSLQLKVPEGAGKRGSIWGNTDQ